MARVGGADGNSEGDPLGDTDGLADGRKVGDDAPEVVAAVADASACTKEDELPVDKLSSSAIEDRRLPLATEASMLASTVSAVTVALVISYTAT